MKRELLVGLVFAVLLGLLLGVTLWVSHPGFFETRPPYRLTARFREVAGLKTGDEVWVYGTKAGRVEEIHPDGKGGVQVDMRLDYDPGMRENAEVKLSQRSALGGAVVAIHPGTPDRPLAERSIYDGTAVADPFREIADLTAELRGPLRETIENARKVTRDLADHSERVAANIDAFAENARALSDDLRQGRGTVGKLLRDETLYTDLRGAVDDLRKLAEDAQAGGGTIDVLLHDRELAADLKETARRARSVAADIDEGRGTVGRLFKDPGLYDELAAAAKDLRGLASDARSGKGVFGRLLYDEKLAARIDTITDDVAQVTGKLRRGEGTLGKLVQDETLYTDFRNALRKFTGGTEDVRENAPILTFAGVLLSGF